MRPKTCDSSGISWLVRPCTGRTIFCNLLRPLPGAYVSPSNSGSGLSFEDVPNDFSQRKISKVLFDPPNTIRIGFH